MKSDSRVFREACIGYGFEEVEQSIDGVYCDACLVVHKRPTKMYSNGRDTMCRHGVVRFYNPEEA